MKIIRLKILSIGVLLSIIINPVYALEQSVLKKYHEKIFEMFQTIDSNNSTGIGLSIVKKIISYYNGEVKVESKTNKETIFYFSLPKKGTMNALLTPDHLKKKDNDTLSN